MRLAMFTTSAKSSEIGGRFSFYGYMFYLNAYVGFADDPNASRNQLYRCGDRLSIRQTLCPASQALVAATLPFAARPFCLRAGDDPPYLRFW
jgi:hypothetical protein